MAAITIEINLQQTFLEIHSQNNTNEKKIAALNWFSLFMRDNENNGTFLTIP